ncbi:hypothetical protein [Chryseobacterium vrystaatense]|uniref:DUF922 domain-containing protein n=1 Tax=Chryseobacterium vrystaatense TaxID=307480 RepID=A0A1M5DTM4_9FLAO|nr:hypothetical protein [Chryseobacterium vrystaatense]SHF70265.1 hypothetical protein SAMN02787073_2711 [Chryseobacterium vrystaatense]
MKKIIYFTVFSCTALLLSFKYQKEDLILWESKRPLKIEDFNIAKKDTIKIANTIKFKGAESKLIYKYEFLPSTLTPPQVGVKVFFDKHESWMLVRDGSTLEHEQIHFNIHEIFARKMRKSIDSLYDLNIRSLDIYMNKINDWTQKSRNYSQLFDKEIDDKIIFSNGKFLTHKNPRQKIWNTKVEKELKELEKYKLK